MSKGRGNASALTIGEVQRYNIDYLRRENGIIKGSELSIVSSWSNGNTIGAITRYTDFEISITFKYNFNGTPVNYKVDIVEVKSNLGNGVNLYFVCPVSGNRCKSLYLCYGSEIFKSMKAYKNRIYYRSQINSKSYKALGEYFDCERKIERFYSKKKIVKSYKGKLTKSYLRFKQLEQRAYYLDRIREQELIKAYNKLF